MAISVFWDNPLKKIIELVGVRSSHALQFCTGELSLSLGRLPHSPKLNLALNLFKFLY
jgi:hypothetical protein